VRDEKMLEKLATHDI
jgi:hypothetical protein